VRLLPRSLFGRLVLILLSGLILAQLVSAYLNLSERDQLLYRASGMQAAQRIADMRKELDINIENAYLIVNRLRGDMPLELKAFTDKMNVPLLGTIPADEALAEFEFSGKPLVELGDESPVYQAIERMLRQVVL